MLNFFRTRSFSLTMVVLVLVAIVVLQESISYSVTFGRLASFVPKWDHSRVSASWLTLRAILLMVTIVLWLFNRKRQVFKAIIVTNGVLTVGLFVNMLALSDALLGFSSQAVKNLLIDVFFMAVTNILIFSIWYWLIDPPGIEETQRVNEPWDFLFPQRGSILPFYESWVPRYTDYLYLAFTTSFAFSPTDTLPLTRRAKMLMLLQATISIITLTGIAGSAINILASNG